ncbi:MAG: hypothetical protein H0W67_03525 [Gemmatimonadales bacterium]|nr:hypothetical protein [Gemmatimonadales bacterium]
MRFTGSPWVRRSETPIAGLAGSAGKAGGDVLVSTISTEDRTSLGYESPPGVIEDVARRGGDRGSLGSQINEKSLRIVATGLDVGDRAEAYLRFPAGPQSVLSYRQLRVWMRGRGPGWEEGDLQAFIKLGADDRNFYLFRSNAKSMTWEPEFIVDLEVWRRLRAELEIRWLRGDPPSGAAECGGDPAAYVICEGPYTVHLADPGINPPNLASVQEVSAGIYRAQGLAVLNEAELWVDDVRLDAPVSETGTAMALDARLVASDVGNVSMAFVRQDGQFRQLNQDPSYRTTGTLQVASNWRLDRFLPTSLGLSVPASVNYARTGVDPQLTTGTDLRGASLPGLRKPTSWSATYSIGVRRSQRSGNWLVHALIDPLGLTSSYTQGRTGTELTDASSRGLALNGTYNLQMRRRGVRLPFAGIAARLPRWLRDNSSRTTDPAILSLVPSNLRLTSSLTRNEGDYSSFGAPVERALDSLVRPTLSLTHLWRNGAGLTWQPLGMLTLNSDLASTRDLRVYPDSTPIGRLAYAERKFLFGVPVGVERDRTLTTALNLTPRISAWLRPRFSTASTFLLSRTLNTRPLVRAGDDSTGAFILPQTLNNGRSRELGVSVDLARAFRAFAGDSSGISRLLARVRPLDLRSQRSRNSTFDLTDFDPGLGYMLGLGGLDRFLGQEGSTAVSAVESRTTTVGSGADLPFGLSATFSYSLIRSDRYQRIGDAFTVTATRQFEWPVGSVRWTHTFRGGPFALIAAGAGFRRREGTSVQIGEEVTSVASATRSSSLTPDLQLGFRNGMNLTFSLASRDQRNENNGNATLLNQDDLTGAFSYSFRVPESISRSRKLVRSSLTAVSSKALTCLAQRQIPDCSVTSDVRRQELRGGLDTDVFKTLSAGLQVGYTINDARNLNRRTSQIFLLTSFQLSLFAGDYR